MRSIVSAFAGVLVNGAAPVPEAWVALNEPVSREERVPFFMTLRRGDAGELRRVYEESSDPRSPRYGEHLSWEAAGELSRPSHADAAEVRAWLAGHGVEELKVHPHGDSLRGTGTVAQLEAMTGGAFVAFRHAETGVRLLRMLDLDERLETAALPSALETLGGFGSLPLDFRRLPPKPVNRSANAGVGYVVPGLIKREFDVVDVAPSGKRNIQAIAQFQGQGFFEVDPPAFCENSGIDGDCSVTKFIGDENLPVLLPFEQITESTLDTEYIHGAMQAVETWVYTESDTDFCSGWLQFLAELTAESTFPYVVSVSYGSQLKGACSSTVVTRSEADVEKLAAMGVTVVLASGDDGSGQISRQGSNCPKLFGECSLTPGWPSSIPAVLSVGSTEFQSESKDEDGCGSCTGPQRATTRFGSGGGFSWDHAVPDYQKDVVEAYLAKTTIPKGKYAKSGRATPDVALNGDDYLIFASYLGERVIGGTSASAPSVASMISLLNEERLKVGKTLGSVNALFYQNQDAFTDVTVGDNGVKDQTGSGSDPEYGWKCESGWDAATGLGTPVFSKLLKIVQELNARDLAKAAEAVV